MRVPPDDDAQVDAVTRDLADRAVVVGLSLGLLLAAAAALVILLTVGAGTDPPPPPPATTTTVAVDIGEPLHAQAAALELEHQAPPAASRGIPRERAKPSREIAVTPLAPVSTPPSELPRHAAGIGYGSPSRTYLGRFRVTCYGPPQFPRGQHTATGDPVGPGSIAVDRRRIPLGTRLELDGIGVGVANDTGSAVKGPHVDLWRPSCRGWANPTVDVWRLP